jgi:hypothetical protein
MLSMQALNKLGFIFKLAYATVVPPADCPFDANKLGWVILWAIKYSAHAKKS